MTSPRNLPLGQREDLTHEWKSAAVLKEGKDKVVREVVAMLNAEGGEIWVGLGEENGYAVRVEPVPEAEAERIRLRDRVTDLIEPAPTSLEVEIEKVAVPEAEGGGAILRVCVRRPADERRPFALKSGEARSFLIRFGDRIRPMDFSEIEAAFRCTSSGTAKKRRASREHAERERRTAESRFPERTSLWLLFLPNPPLSESLNLVPLQEFLVEPDRSNNVDIYHWESFVVPGRRVERSADRLLISSEERCIELRRDGSVNCQATLITRMQLGGALIESKLFAFSFVPLLISATRLAAALFSNYGEPAGLRVELGIFKTQGLVLHPGNPFSHPSSLWWRMPPDTVGAGRVEEDSIAVSGEFPRQDFVESPDRCAFRLIRRIYDAAGLDESTIPWWNPTSQRFDLKR